MILPLFFFSITIVGLLLFQSPPDLTVAFL
jgi:hypothetical protein